jgi:hypothetical protein
MPILHETSFLTVCLCYSLLFHPSVCFVHFAFTTFLNQLTTYLLGTSFGKCANILDDPTATLGDHILGVLLRITFIT